MSVYYTISNDGYSLHYVKTLQVAATRDEAEAAIRAQWAAHGMKVERIDFASWGDAAIKVHSAPDSDDLVRWAKTFGLDSADDFVVQTPGEHPGGRAWWITPRVDVLAAVELCNA